MFGRSVEQEYAVFFCFFFQAEDGIRDLTVTGVQTCALPISDRLEFLQLSVLRSAPFADAEGDRSSFDPSSHDVYVVLTWPQVVCKEAALEVPLFASAVL